MQLLTGVGHGWLGERVHHLLKDVASFQAELLFRVHSPAEPGQQIPKTSAYLQSKRLPWSLQKNLLIFAGLLVR